jgi:hypothetical protein
MSYWTDFGNLIKTVIEGGKVKTTATLNVGDIEIGAVELKDATTDTRAVINSNGGVTVAIDQTTANARNVSSAGSVAEVQKTRPANTTAYTALDVIGTDAATNIEFTNVIPVSADTVIITGAYMRIYTASVPSGMSTFRLHLYNVAPTAITDNLAFTTADADRSKYLGFIEFDTPIAIGGNILWTQKENLNLVRKLVSTSVFGVLQTVTGFTPTSGCVKEIGLCVLGR